MPRTRPFPRFLAPRVREALRDSPAVLIHGPRQSGKTTLARAVGEAQGYRYVSFDDALETNDSALKVLGDETLKTIARELGPPSARTSRSTGPSATSSARSSESS